MKKIGFLWPCIPQPALCCSDIPCFLFYVPCHSPFPFHFSSSPHIAASHGCAYPPFNFFPHAHRVSKSETFSVANPKPQMYWSLVQDASANWLLHRTNKFSDCQCRLWSFPKGCTQGELQYLCVFNSSPRFEWNRSVLRGKVTDGVIAWALEDPSRKHKRFCSCSHATAQCQGPRLHDII